MRYLGIDYGSKRIGLSVSDEEGRVAFPHSVISNDSRTIETIRNIIVESGIEAVVIGESKDFSGKDNYIQKEIDIFAKEMEAQEMDLKFFSEPEFMTSAQAEKITGKNEKSDSSAAALILQSFLDRMNNS